MVHLPSSQADGRQSRALANTQTSLAAARQSWLLSSAISFDTVADMTLSTPGYSLAGRNNSVSGRTVISRKAKLSIGVILALFVTVAGWGALVVHAVTHTTLPDNGRPFVFESHS